MQALRPAPHVISDTYAHTHIERERERRFETTLC